MAKGVVSCRPDEPVEAAQRIMAEKQLRRLPVVDEEGRAVGVLSLNDVIRHAASARTDAPARDVVNALARVCQPRAQALRPASPPVGRRRQPPTASPSILPSS
jgi:CBS-domain-containing membrane protein